MVSDWLGNLQMVGMPIPEVQVIPIVIDFGHLDWHPNPCFGVLSRSAGWLDFLIFFPFIFFAEKATGCFAIQQILEGEH